MEGKYWNSFVQVPCYNIDNTASLNLSVVNTITNPTFALREIRVYCSYWLINNTGWPFGRLDLRCCLCNALLLLLKVDSGCACICVDRIRT